MEKMLEAGPPEKAPKKCHETTWYISHYGVCHPKKPDKLRVVFDCSEEVQGYSLNRNLLQGRDLANTLDQGDTTKDPTEYRTTVHLFGATSSPSCANLALRTAANDGVHEFGEAVSFIKENFFVDDGLRKVRANVQEQKMANLPSDRLEPAPPFAYYGIDCFGPWYTREGRKDLMRGLNEALAGMDEADVKAEMLKEDCDGIEVKLNSPMQVTWADYGSDGNPPATFSNDNLGFPEISYVPTNEKDDYGNVADNDVNVTLTCKVAILNGIEKWKNVSYWIEWFAEGKILKNETICGGLLPGKENQNPCPDNKDLTSLLPGKNYIIGQSISCEISAKFTTSPENVWSSPKQVPQPFFAGLKVHPTVLNLEACNLDHDHHTITITPTIPVRKTTRGLPKLTFRTPREVTILTGCQIDLKPDVEPVEISVKALCGQKVSEGLKLVIPKILQRNSLFWNKDVGLPTIWVHVRAKKEIEQCKSWGDPHYRTLQPLTFGPQFHFYGKGDFVLYKNTERYFEVQTRQWSCGGSFTCNCGVVIRDHNNVIEFNSCNVLLERDSSSPLRVKIRSEKCLSPGISIKKTPTSSADHDMYEVLFPSGAKVVIERFPWGLDVSLYTPRASNEIQESGLCLYPPGPDHNAYGENLRLLHNQSYFDVLPPHVNDTKVDYSDACQCVDGATGHGNADCVNAFDVAFPTVNEQNLSPMFLCDRQKRDIQFSDDPTDEDFELFKQTPPLRMRRRREVKKITKENATDYCAERISETKIGKLCAKVGVDLQALVDVCSMDIEYTGDYSYVSGGVVAMTDQCGNLAALNLSSATNSTNSSSGDEGGSAGRALVEAISASLCPKDCSFNGNCINGSCLCYKDFTADDCSAYVYEIPSIQSLQANGLCDRRTRPCRKVTVLGTGFIPTENMTCHVREFKVVNSSWQPYNTELKLPGVMTDLVLADCNLPESPVSPGYFHEVDEGTPAAGLVISVSNDGDHKSNENLTFISYDSACMRCNISSGCSLKDNSCFINGYCFAPNESNPIDFCSQCLPDVNASTWTKRRVNFPPKFSSINQFYALYKENLELAINVSDPEGMPVTVTLMDGSPVHAVIRGDNVLVWNATSSPRTQFMLKATDACQAVSTYNITISLVVCQCQNNGSCIPHPNSPRGSGLYQCNCAPGFTGDKCQTDIDECLSYPCLRGRCIDEINNFSCICDPGYVGRTCDTDYDDCSSSPCVHGNCIDYTGSYGCTCEPGYAGENCEININECVSSPCRHGTCVDQVNNYICQCHAGYTGYDCTIEINECQSSPCVHGTCSDKVNGFTCSCEAGFSGMSCDMNVDECLSSPCVNGICSDLVNNYTCSCNVGYTGRDCDVVITTCTEDSCFPNVTCFKSGPTISCGPCPFGFTGDGKNCRDINNCANHTCANGASCIDSINSYSCNCTAGFTGTYCETDMDDCANHTCANGASCVDGVNSYSCNCTAGFTGTHCETDIDECTNHTCDNGASCVDGINRYFCRCTAGFTGPYCETDMDDCTNHTCANGASCIDAINSYFCNCTAGFTGPHCETDMDDCTNHTCANGASCVDGVNSYSCHCIAGFTGPYCETDMDDCTNHTCANGASCVDGANSYSCHCTAGFTGPYCETDMDDCTNHTCANGASCVDGVNSYSCHCTAGFTGPYCETDMDDCTNHTCANGASCVDGANSYSCHCTAGFTGPYCETDMDDCTNHTCANGASCVDGVKSYSCHCTAGFTGPYCETDMDDCTNHTCANGASCVDGVKSYSCHCTAGFTGPYCETDMDDCTNHTCANGASCVDGVKSYSCHCTAGFTGPYCETDMDDCTNHTCANGASCVDGVNSYSCHCTAGFTGPYCETDIDDCANHTCANSALCVDGINTYLCNCRVGFTGTYCETDMDDCTNHTCANGASCVDGVNTYFCNCTAGFTGTYCETDMDDCAYHTCANGASCVDGINSYSCNCTAGFTGVFCETDNDDCVNHACANGASCVDAINSYWCNCTVGFTGAYCETDLSPLTSSNWLAKTASSPPQGYSRSPSTLPSKSLAPSSGVHDIISTQVNPIVAETSTSDKLPSTRSYLTSNAVSSRENKLLFATTSLNVPITPSSSAVASVSTRSTPSTPSPEIEYAFSIKILEDWTDDLQDTESDAFQELSFQFETEIKKKLSETRDFIGVKVISFRKGSIVAEFKLIFNTKVQREEALDMMKEKINDGNLGRLRVDPATLEPIPDGTEGPPEDPPYAIIIGASFAGLFFLVLGGILFYRLRKNRKAAEHKKRNWDDMPPDEAFPNPEKYQMKSMENILYGEATDLWDEHEAGMSNKGFK
ncbi:uncharacterized protein [Montipora foliosa]|uniref:uncharacterized protein n=1 Tax=Montipora foliosa TaxID=591990 RepID=UPI0035F1E54B